MVNINDANLSLIAELSAKLGMNVRIDDEYSVNAVLNVLLRWLANNYKIVTWTMVLDKGSESLLSTFINNAERLKNHLDETTNECILRIEKIKAEIRDTYVSTYMAIDKLKDDIDNVVKEINELLNQKITIGCRHFGPDILKAYTYLTSKSYIPKAVGTDNYRALLNAVSFAMRVCSLSDEQ
jgi:hypothetical protein